MKPGSGGLGWMSLIHEMGSKRFGVSYFFAMTMMMMTMMTTLFLDGGLMDGVSGYNALHGVLYSVHVCRCVSTV